MGNARRRLTLGVVVLGLAVAGLPGEARSDVDLWPLLRTTETEMTVLYPFFVREKEFLMVFPFYYRKEGDHHVLWPLIKASEGRVVRAAPLYFRGENRDRKPDFERLFSRS